MTYPHLDKYIEIKRRSRVNLDLRESWVLKFYENGDKKLLWLYLRDEVKPLLEQFPSDDREIVRNYFRSIAGIKDVPFNVFTLEV